MKKVKPIMQLLKCMEFDFRIDEGELIDVTVRASSEKIDRSEIEIVDSLVECFDSLEPALTQECIAIHECTLFKILEVSEDNILQLSGAFRVYDDYLSELACCDTTSEARSVVTKIKKLRREITKLIKGLKIGKTDVDFTPIYSDTLEKDI